MLRGRQSCWECPAVRGRNTVGLSHGGRREIGVRVLGVEGRAKEKVVSGDERKDGSV